MPISKALTTALIDGTGAITPANVTVSTNNLTVGTALYVAANGNVGIGASGPSQKLQVNGNAFVNGFFISGSVGTPGYISYRSTGVSQFDIGLIGGDSDLHGYVYNRQSGGNIIFGSNNIQRMAISSAGDVNIGGAATTAAGGLRYLDLYNTETSNVNSGSIIRLITANSTGGSAVTVDMIKYRFGGFYINNNDANGIISFGTAGTSNKLFVAANGNVGVDTTAPGYKLDVNGIARVQGVNLLVGNATSAAEIVLNSSSSNKYSDVDFSFSGINQWRFGTNGDNNLNIWNFTNSATYFSIDPTGNISSSSNRYSFVNTGGTAGYVYLGRWSSTNQDGAKLKMTITSGLGYNAGNAQNQITEIFFKVSNGVSFISGSTGNFFADGAIWKLGPQINSPVNVRVVAIDATTYDFYGYFGQFSGDVSFYTVSIGKGRWTHSGTFFGASSPSGNFIDLTVNFYGTLDSNSILQNANAIKFPATQVSSGDANTLDDYEEGSWTPRIDSNNGQGTFTTRVGHYIKIGRKVTAWFLCDGGNSLAAGTTQYLSGLPFSIFSSYSGTTCIGQMGTNGPTIRTQQLMTLSANRSVAYVYVGGSQETTTITYASGVLEYLTDN